MEKANPRIFDRSVYSSTTISVFQIVGAYFVDIYYNHLYTEAIKFKTDGRVASVTEGYRHATFAFLTALDNKAKGYKPEHYNKLIQGINEYFLFWTVYSSLTLSECINKIVREFVPADYFASLDKEQKRNILRSVLIESIREFTRIVIGEFLGAIIDNHDEPANVEALKEKIVDTFIMQREAMFHKFLDCRAGGKPDEKVDKKFVDKLRAEIIRLNQQNQELINSNKGLNEQLTTVKSSAEEVVRRFKLLKNKYDSVIKECRTSKEKAKDLEEALDAKRFSNPVSGLVSNPVLNPMPNARPTSIFEDEDEDEDEDKDAEDSMHVENRDAEKKEKTAEKIGGNPRKKELSKPGSSALSSPILASKPAAKQPAHSKPASKPAAKQPAGKPAGKPAAKQSAHPKPASKPPVQNDTSNTPHTPDVSDTEESDVEGPEVSKGSAAHVELEEKIRIPQIIHKKEELPPKNEMDEVLAKHITENTDSSLGKPPSISDIY